MIRLIAALALAYCLYPFPLFARDQASYANQPVYINGGCDGAISPAIAVIPGMIVSEGSSPKDAKRGLGSKVAKIKEIATAVKGRLKAQEIVRWNKSSSPDLIHFVFVQRVEIVLPASADVDLAISELGDMNGFRFGTNTHQIHYRNSNPQIAVQYQFENIENTLDEMLLGCKVEAIEKWCSENHTPQAEALCTDSAEKIASTATVSSMNLQSQPVIQAHGSSSAVYLNYPWRFDQFRNLTLGGNITLELKGYMQIQARVPAD